MRMFLALFSGTVSCSISSLCDILFPLPARADHRELLLRHPHLRESRLEPLLGSQEERVDVPLVETVEGIGPSGEPDQESP